MFFFLQTIPQIVKDWDSALSQIPLSPKQKEDEGFYKIAGGVKLDKYSYLNILDSLAKTYPQYSHDDLWLKDFDFVMNLVAYNKEKGYINARFQEIKEKNN